MCSYEHIMQIELNESGLLMQTDYWECEEGALAGVPWVQRRNGVWHVLAPSSFRWDHRFPIAAVTPVTASEQPEGWQWMLIGGWDGAAKLRIPCRCFLGRCPDPPPPGTVDFHALMLYGHIHQHREKVTWDFGHHLAEIRPTWQCDLLVLRKPAQDQAPSYQWLEIEKLLLQE